LHIIVNKLEIILAYFEAIEAAVIHRTQECVKIGYMKYFL